MIIFAAFDRPQTLDPYAGHILQNIGNHHAISWMANAVLQVKIYNRQVTCSHILRCNTSTATNQQIDSENVPCKPKFNETNFRCYLLRSALRTLLIQKSRLYILREMFWVPICVLFDAMINIQYLDKMKKLK